MITKEAEEQATGCVNVGDYRKFALRQGFKFIEVLDTTSSAGDWSFLVSRDKHKWNILFQENNYPRAGFTYTLGNAEYQGTLEEVYEIIDQGIEEVIEMRK